MRRQATTAALLLLTLAGCHPDTNDAAAPTPTASGDVCERVRPHLSGNWTAEHGIPRPSAPLSDTCYLVDAAQTAHRVRVMVSILPVTDAQALAYRKADEASVARLGYAAKITDGGMGTGSWALDPAAAAPWLVFRTGGRQVRLRVENAGAGTMEELRSIARSITDRADAVPSAPETIVLPECNRGTAAAEHVLGGRAVVRRDVLVDKHLWCQWGSATRSVWVTAGALGSDDSIDFDELKQVAPMKQSHRVTVGAEGWQQNDGFLTFTTRQGQYVSIASAPYEQMRPIPIVMLARAIEPAYS